MPQTLDIPKTINPPHPFRPTYISGIVLLFLTYVLMTLSFAPFYLWPLGHFCLLPFAICILRRPMNWKWLTLYYLLGCAFFLIDLGWLVPVNPGGWAALSLFVALYFLLFAIIARRMLVKLRWPALLALPIAFTATEYLRSTILSGFAWFMLGTSQTPNQTILQSADLFGVSGLTFLCAMTSGILLDCLALPLKINGHRNPRLQRLINAYLATLLAVLAYGTWRLSQKTATAGPRVSVVQEFIPQSIKDAGSDENDEAIFQKHLALSYQAAKDHPDLIAWPETMVPGNLNPEFLNLNPNDFLHPDEVQAALKPAHHFDAALTKLATDTKAHVLVGAAGRLIDRDIKQNLAILYAPTTGQEFPYYAKRHLVCFGEYVPFKDSWPWLHHLLLALTPFNGYDYSLTPGTTWTTFGVSDSAGHPFRFGAPICYEDVMPEPARGFVSPRRGIKNADFLVTISNDGWYVSNAELEQHLQLDQIRAVEERVPIARSVNGGDSGIIDSSGRIIALVNNHGKSKFVPGVATAIMPVDSRISPYSRLGDAFPIACVVVSLLAFLYSFRREPRP